MSTIILDKWDGSIVNDPRDPAENACRMCTGFDTLTNPYKMTPNRESENGDGNSANHKKQNFTLAIRTGTTYSLFALGYDTGSIASVEYKNLTLGAANDLDDSSWNNTSNSIAPGGSSSVNLFIWYKQTGKIYGAHSGTHIWTYDPTGSAAWDNTAHALSYTNIGDGIVHSKDDRLYIPYDNKIARYDGSTWTDAAITLPSHLYITNIAENGNNIAIAAAPLSGVGPSRIYIWDRDASLTTLSETIPWGFGVCTVVADLDGVLIGITLDSNNETRNKYRVVFKYYDGYIGQPFLTLESSTLPQISRSKQLIDNRLYFMMKLTLNGSIREGTWSIGREGGRFVLNHEAPLNNDTATTTSTVNSFIKIGDFLFQSYVDNGSYALSKTVEGPNATYSATSVRETTINPNMPAADRHKLKKLEAVAGYYEALPTAGSVTLKCRIDGATSWTTLFTETTDGATYTRPISTPIGNFYEIEFRIESTGGAVITGIPYRYTPIPTATL